jgi:acyl-CoA thioesterase FadM
VGVPVGPVHSAEFTSRHDELDLAGRLRPSALLRYLSHAAVEASTAAGFDADWYARAGGLWLVRRSTFTVARPTRADERLVVRTWVEDFRRVRSHRRYEVRNDEGALVAEARTDWVYVDRATGRPRRIPPEMEMGFGTATERATEPREAWRAPTPPATPATAVHRVQLSEIDPLGHVNNAVYLDLVSEAVFDTLAGAGWPLARLLEARRLPLLVRGDLEYLDSAKYGDRLETLTWFTPAPGALDAHHLVRCGSERLVRAATRWRWMEGALDLPATEPDGLGAALSPIMAA